MDDETIQKFGNLMVSIKRLLTQLTYTVETMNGHADMTEAYLGDMYEDLKVIRKNIEINKREK